MTWFSRMHALRTPWLGWWLAVAMVLAPALGRMHEVLHAPFLVTQAHAASTAPSHGVAAWFDGHDALACLVLDQLGHGASDTPTAMAASHALPAQPPVWVCTAHLLPAAQRIFLARAPPRHFMG